MADVNNSSRKRRSVEDAEDAEYCNRKRVATGKKRYRLAQALARRVRVLATLANQEHTLPIIQLRIDSLKLRLVQVDLELRKELTLYKELKLYQ